MSTLADLRYRIAAVRQKEKNVVIMAGMFRLVLAFVGVIIAYFLIDWIFDLPYAARLVAIAAGLGALGYVVYKYLVCELRRIVDEDEVALRVEARNPDLRGRLISTLQLSRAGEKGEFVGSPELIAALEDETGQMSRPLDFSKIINREMFIRLAIAAAVVVVIKTALLIRFTPYFAALGSRLVHPDAQFPTRTHISNVKIPSYVARGDDIAIEVTIDDGGPEVTAGTVQFTSPGKSSMTVDLAPGDRLRFTGVLAKAMEEVDAVVMLGDAKSLPKHIKVLPRPEIDVEKSSVKYNLPKYATAADPKLQDLPPEKLNTISALTGSTADIKIASTKTLHSITLDRSDGKSFALTKLDAEGKLWGFTAFQIEKSASFHISMIDTDELRNSEPAVEYAIEAKPDYPPTIKLERPTKDTTVTSGAKPVLVFSAHDDYNVRTIWLMYRINTLKAGGDVQEYNKGKLERYEIPIKPQKNLDKAKFTWDNFGALNLKKDDQIVFWLEADDDCEANDWIKPGTGAAVETEPGDPKPEQRADGMIRSFPKTTDIKLTIVTKEQKTAELQAAAEAIYKELEGQKLNQEEIKKRIREALDAMDH
jgi:hypothetical protein